MKNTLTLLLLTFSGLVIAAESTSSFQSEEIREGFFVMTGGGSNSIVSIGEDGVLMVDNELPENFPAIQAEIARHTDKDIAIVFNTHWHPDHIGGNAELNSQGALTIGHENLKRRLRQENYIPLIDARFPPFAETALPNITFTGRMNLHFNNNDVEVYSFPGSHTDGDIVVFFRQANLIHAGGVFYNYRYPYVDADAGGTLRGTIEASRYLLTLMDEQTLIVPGHGDAGRREDLQDTLNMLESTSRTMRELIDQGLSLEEIVDKKPNHEWDGIYGNNTLSPEDYTRWLYHWVSTEG